MNLRSWNLKKGSRVVVSTTTTNANTIIGSDIEGNKSFDTVPQSDSSHLSSTVQSRIVEIQTHDIDFAADELVLNSTAFINWTLGSYVYLRAVTISTTLSSLTSTPIYDTIGISCSTDVTIDRDGSNPKNLSSKIHISSTSSGGGDSNRQAGGVKTLQQQNESLVIDAASRKGALVVKLTSDTRLLKGTLLASLRKDIASAAGFIPRQLVEIRLVSLGASKESLKKIEEDTSRADSKLKELHPARLFFGLEHVEFSFKDQHASRSSMWRFRLALSTSMECLYVGQNIQRAGLRMTVRELGARVTVLGGPNSPASLGDLLPVISGVVTPNTKITFRSRSSKIVLLIQLSREMYAFDNHGTARFEVLINQFLPALFSRWCSSGATHSLSVVFFGRTEYSIVLPDLVQLIEMQNEEGKKSSKIGGSGNNEPRILADRALFLNLDGKLCEDFYYTVVDNFIAASSTSPVDFSVSQLGGGGLSTDWSRLMSLVKKAFYTFPTVAKWGGINLNHKKANDISSDYISTNQSSTSCSPQEKHLSKSALFSQSKLLTSLFICDEKNKNNNSQRIMSLLSQGAPTLSSKGNFLEAINLSLNNMDRHHVDRDMERMGCNVIVLTSGDGTFDVDPALAQMTKQRMMDNGCGCDTVCLTRPPLHNVPLFVTRTPRNPNGVVTKSPIPLERIDSDGDLNNKQSSTTDSVVDATTAEAQWVISYSMPHWLHCSFYGYGSDRHQSHSISLKEKRSNSGIFDESRSKRDGSTHLPFKPLSSSILFSLYWPRISPYSIANPSLLLEILRLSHVQSGNSCSLEEQKQGQNASNKSSFLQQEEVLRWKPENVEFFALRKRGKQNFVRGTESSFASIHKGEGGYTILDIDPSDSAFSLLPTFKKKYAAYSSLRPWSKILNDFSYEEKLILFEKSKQVEGNEPVIQLGSFESFTVNTFVNKNYEELDIKSRSENSFATDCARFDAHDVNVFSSKEKPSTDSPLIQTNESLLHTLPRTRSYGLDKSTIKATSTSISTLCSVARIRAMQLFLPSVPGDIKDQSLSREKETPQLFGLSKTRSKNSFNGEEEVYPSASSTITMQDLSLITASPIAKYCALPTMSDFFSQQGSIPQNEPLLSSLSDAFVAITLAAFSPSSFITCVRMQIAALQHDNLSGAGARIALASPSRPFLRQNSMSMLSLAALEEGGGGGGGGGGGAGKSSPEILTKSIQVTASLESEAVSLNNFEIGMRSSNGVSSSDAPIRSILTALEPDRIERGVGRTVLLSVPLLPLSHSSFVNQPSSGLSVSFADDDNTRMKSSGVGLSSSSGIDIGLDLTSLQSNARVDQVKPLSIFDHMKQPSVASPSLSALNQRSYGRSSRSTQRSRPTAHSVFSNERAVSPTRLVSQPSFSSSASYQAQSSFSFSGLGANPNLHANPNAVPSSSSSSNSLTSAFISHLFSPLVDVFPPGAGAGISTDGAYVLPPAAGATLNPFRRRRRDLQLATANRRRWWHLFPADQVAEQQFTTPSNKDTISSSNIDDDENGLEPMLFTFVPNWKSLCEPAIIPLTTDFLPSETELRSQFAESVYSIALPIRNDKSTLSSFQQTSSNGKYTTQTNVGAISERPIVLLNQEQKNDLHARLFEEMICQRLAQEFQVVELSTDISIRSFIDNPLTNEDIASSTTTTISSTLVPISKPVIRRARLLSEGNIAAGTTGGLPPTSHLDSSRGGPEKGWIIKPNNPTRKTIILSMGHYIHVLTWNIIDENVEVCMYFRRPGVVYKAPSSLKQQLQSQMSLSNFGNSHSSSSTWATSPFWTVPSALNVGIGNPRGPMSPAMGPFSAADFQTQQQINANNSTSRGGAGNAAGLSLHRVSSYSSVSAQIPLKGVTSSNNFSFLDLPEVGSSSASSDVMHTTRQFIDGESSISSNLLNASGSSLTTQGKSLLAGDLFGAIALSTIARTFSNAFVDASGTYKYRFSIFCPLRQNAVATGRTFRISSSAIKVLHLHGGGGGGGGGGSGQAMSIINSLIHFPQPPMRPPPSSSTPMVGLPAPIPLAMSFSSSSTGFDKTPSSTPNFGPRSPLAITSSSTHGLHGSGYISMNMNSNSSSGSIRSAQFQGLQRPSKPLDDETNWSFLDALLIGDQTAGAQPLPESTRYSRVCFLLLPLQPVDAANLTAAEAFEKCSTVILSFQIFWETHILKFVSKLKDDKDCHLDIYSPFSVPLQTNSIGGTIKDEIFENKSVVSTDNSTSSSSLRIELDSLGPSPFEWGVLHYGSVYNPMRTFPMTLQWIAASPVAIENFISETSRKARQNGFFIQQIAEYTRKAPVQLNVVSELRSTTNFASTSTSTSTTSPIMSSDLTSSQQKYDFQIPSASQSTIETGTLSCQIKQLITVLQDSVDENDYAINRLKNFFSGLSALQLNLKIPIFDSLPSFMLTAPIPIFNLVDGIDGILNDKKILTFALFEYALVKRLGFVQDKASNGTESVTILGTSTSSSTNGIKQLFSTSLYLSTLSSLEFSSKRSSSLNNIDQLTLHQSTINTKGWYRQYFHVQRLCCVRIHANGASWLPCETKNSRYDDEFESTNLRLYVSLCTYAKFARNGDFASILDETR